MEFVALGLILALTGLSYGLIRLCEKLWVTR
jgi:hypothetical protein